ncbi:siderophore-interacting protein [Leucobacter triazinivorans]|uniref:Siderophore-interacting protein n=1 Tax=Leucobacter triazinivorans TaxID=1784719 RepID=A0A4P6KHR2_9MICO|nr:siderophore-interacting protein [Leucobacter triazinivorans]
MAQSPFAVARAKVVGVERISPTFVRATFGGEPLRGIGNPGRTLDQRIKLIFPPESGALPQLADAPDWYAAWLAIPEEARGSMRTYSIRELQVEQSGETRLVVDFVLHLEPGATGPASLWASRAAVGDELLLIAPRRGRLDGGGIEFEPGAAASVLLAGDETAAPAIARILEELPAEARGIAFIEVPLAADRLPVDAPAGVEVRWLPRGAALHGAELIPAVLEHLGDPPRAGGPGATDAENGAASGGQGAEQLLWETPQYSGLGEEIGQDPGRHERYFWIAGESGVVTSVRRHLVRELGIARSQVAFMGYWRRGVAMKG